MCKFFSFVTDPDNHGGKRFYFDWNYRKENMNDSESHDSHSTICEHYKLVEDRCNKYEFNPLTKEFTVDRINSSVDDRIGAQVWVEKLNWKKIVEPLIAKDVINALTLNNPDVNDKVVSLLKQWASVRDSVRDSVLDSVWDSVRDSVWDSVWDSVRAYTSSFFDIEYKYDISPAIELWNMGFVPSFDGTTWRLHAGKNATIVFEITKEELMKR